MKRCQIRGQYPGPEQHYRKAAVRAGTAGDLSPRVARHPEGQTAKHHIREVTMHRFFNILYAAATVMLVCSCSSDRGPTVTMNACNGVPDCVAVTSDKALPFSSETGGEQISLACPSSHPYFWYWQYEGHAGLETSLLTADNVSADDTRSGATFKVAGTGSSGPQGTQPNYRIYLACSSRKQDVDQMTRGLSALENGIMQAVPLVFSDVIRSDLPLNVNATPDRKSYVGQEIWKSLREVDNNSKYLGITYNYSESNLLDHSSFLLQTPANAWGASANEYYFRNPDTCPDKSKTCNSQFRLQECTSDTDCVGSGAGTACRAVEATVLAPGQTPKNLCVRPQDVLWNEVYKVMVSGEHLVDVTTMNQTTQAPDGSFKEAIRNAATYLAVRSAATGTEVNIRLLIGHFKNLWVYKKDLADLLNHLISDAKSVVGAKISLQVGAYYSSFFHKDFMSLNHSKIVAADGKTATIGGQNMYADDYLSINPAFDVTLKESGPVAYDAHSFASRLWKYVLGNTDDAGSIHYYSWKAGEEPKFNQGGFDTIPATVKRVDGAGTVPVFGVGRLGVGVEAGDYGYLSPYQSSNHAQLAMIRSAKNTIRISQQDVIWGPAAAIDKEYDVWSHTWYNQPAMELLAQKLATNEFDVYIVVSNLWSKTGATKNGSYYNGLAPERIGEAFKWYLEKNALYNNLPPYMQYEVLCKRLHIATLRIGDNNTWSDGTPHANHAKTIIVDDQAFYVGSHNFYPMNLQEYGVIVDDKTTTGYYIGDYWDRLWGYSKRSAVTGSDSPNACMFYK